MHKLKLLIDKRIFPWALWNFVVDQYRSLSYLSQSKDKSNVVICLTCDAEDTVTSKVSEISAGLKDFAKVFTRKTVGTILIQGALVNSQRIILKKLSRQGFEIGLHGFTHDNWGETQWFLTDKVLTTREKNDYLTKAGAVFKKASLPAPRSFRAPNLNSNNATSELLKKNGYTVDSSFPSFLGYGSINITKGELTYIPVSSFSRSHLASKGPVPFLTYQMWTTENIIKWSRSELLQRAKEIIDQQLSLGIKPCLVILTHSWEFSSNFRFKYASKINIKKLRRALSWLEDGFNVNYLTLQAYAKEMK